MLSRKNVVDYLVNLALRGIIFLVLLVPYRARVRMMGALVQHVVSPLAGYDKRVRDNLALVLPDLPPSEVKRLQGRVVNNAGRTLIEEYSGAEFQRFVAATPIKGPGFQAFENGQARGQGTIFITGHFGNYDVTRAVFSARGLVMGGLYQPFHNAYFDAHYRRTLRAIGEPIFPRGRAGLGAMLRHLRGGGNLGLLNDQNNSQGAALTFFGRKAMTATSAAELAIKYNCLFVPVYAVRQADGLHFELHFDAPIPHSTPEAMTQAFNDSLEKMVRAHMDQWFWVHRRWWPAEAPSPSENNQPNGP